MSLQRPAGCVLLLMLAACQPPQPPSVNRAVSAPATPAVEPDRARPAIARADPANPEDWRLPGSFAADTTVQDLRQRFGAQHVQVGEIQDTEGDSYRGVTLFPDLPERRATVFFQNEQALSGLSMIRINDPGSAWRLDSGVGIGTSFAEVRRINGRPFVFTGFGWDYGGTILDWQDGHLAVPGEAVALAYVRLDLGEQGSDKHDHDERELPIGDQDFSSEDPRWRKLDMKVAEIRIGFPGQDDL